MTRFPHLIPLLSTLAPAVLVAALPAHAADAPSTNGPVAATFGNTVFSVYPDGRSQKIWLSPDGKWTGLSRRGIALAGTWTTKGEKVCLKQSQPPTLPLSFCQTFPEDPMNGIDSKDLTGQHIHLKLVKGHVEKEPG